MSPHIDPAMIGKVMGEPSFEEQCRRDMETAMANPVLGFIDKMWSDFGRDQRKRYPEVYALGGRLIREREAREAFSGRPAEGRRDTVGVRARLIARLIVRDGDDCCYCHKPLGDDMTLEHRVAQSNGGDDDFDNLTLAHRGCNQRVGNLPPDMKDDLAARERDGEHIGRGK